MYRFFSFFLFLLPLFSSDESFITQIEYGKMLYENPRGIGCIYCHGKYGEGQKIAHFTHKKSAKTLYAPNLQTLSFESFSKALQKSRKVMPKYYLTKEEQLAIFRYIEAMQKRNLKSK